MDTITDEAVDALKQALSGRWNGERDHRVRALANGGWTYVGTNDVAQALYDACVASLGTFGVDYESLAENMISADWVWKKVA